MFYRESKCDFRMLQNGLVIYPINLAIPNKSSHSTTKNKTIVVIVKYMGPAISLNIIHGWLKLSLVPYIGLQFSSKSMIGLCVGCILSKITSITHPKYPNKNQDTHKQKICKIFIY